AAAVRSGDDRRVGNEQLAGGKQDPRGDLAKAPHCTSLPASAAALEATRRVTGITLHSSCPLRLSGGGGIAKLPRSWLSESGRCARQGPGTSAQRILRGFQ